MRHNPFLMIAGILVLCALHTMEATAQLRDMGSEPRISNINKALNDDPRALQAMAFQLSSTKPDSALILARRSMDIFRQLGQINMMVRSQEIVGIAYMSLGKLDSALVVFERCRDQNILLQDSLQLASSLFLIGSALNQKGDIRGAISHHLKSVAINKRIGVPDLQLVETYNILGQGYFALNDLDQAYHYLNSALEISDSMNLQLETATVLNNIAFVLSERGEFHEAVSTLKRSLRITQGLGIPQLALRANLNLSVVYGKMGDPDSSMYYVNRANMLNERVKDVLSSFGIEYQLSVLKQEQGFLREALVHGEQALTLANPMGFKGLSDIHLQLSRLYEKAGDYQKALVHYQRYSAFVDSLNVTGQRVELDRMALEYEHNRETDMLKAMQEAREAALQREITTQRISLVGIGILLCIAVYVSYLAVRRNRENKQINELLRESNAAIASQRDQLERQTRELNETNHLKDRLLSIISHDLRGPLASITTVLDLIKEGMLTQEEIHQVFADIRQMADNNTKMLDNLLIWARQQWKGGDILRPEHYQLAPTIRDKMALFEAMAKSKQVALRNDVPPAIPVYADPSMMDVVLHNLISNAIKFSHAGGVVTVSASRIGNRTMISISDTGVGIPKENVERLFSTEAFTTLGTQKESGTGLGLIVCRDFVRANHGQIQVESAVGQGSVFRIELPSEVISDY